MFNGTVEKNVDDILLSLSQACSHSHCYDFCNIGKNIIIQISSFDSECFTYLHNYADGKGSIGSN